MKKNTIFILSQLVLSVACNGGGGGGSGASGKVQPQPAQSVKSCDVVFNKTDTIPEAAVKGDKARNECGLTEQEIERLIDNAE
jgi:hypothetical protein